MTVAIAYILDLIFGDPYHWPHPVSAMGKAIRWGEKKWNRDNKRFWKGMMLSLFLVGLTFTMSWGILFLAKKLHLYAYYVVEIVGVYFCLANRCLIDEGKAVWKALEMGLDQGRERLSWIVGRETQKLSEQQVKRATLETLSENLSDGVVAPLFWLAIGGLPAMMAYKMVNTLDSMIGYKNRRYIDFGKFAARLDDVVNFIPARLTGLLIVILNVSRRGLVYMLRFGQAHSSPNAAYPEAALAGVLNARFGGPNYYHGQLVNKPFIGETEKRLTKKDLIITVRTNHGVSLLMVALIVLIQFVS
ncbi:adenosylcobinamide-phosphate synthase CbiB [Xanthovirga aplysinae]|uniref:adenosylcobinamide-phosphate synthase CbiB n=1 Tax=Xanthovirga aplysinae TaxID=2529853 RepID=UPI0012BBEDF4|nr:adenosylcobinamide-phosphate synthase CbiB [Xanthovirga aplysinae]MTI32342.1 cobalamin biosynthesis protein CobD [Xanthovirga aplysinae]